MMIRRAIAILIFCSGFPAGAFAQGYKGLIAPQPGYQEPKKEEKKMTAPTPKKQSAATPLPASPPPAVEPPDNEYLASALQDVDAAHLQQQKETAAYNEKLLRYQQDQLARALARQKAGQ